MAPPVHWGRFRGGGVFAFGSRRFVGGDARDPLARARLAAAIGRGGWPVVKPHQVHSARVWPAARLLTGEDVEGDAVLCRPGERAAGMVVAGDCLLIALGGSAGSVAAVHAGWRGLVAGAVEATAVAVRVSGEEVSDAVVGPVIEAGCYEFGAGDLDAVAGRYGERVRARTAAGTAALDLRAAATAALTTAGVTSISHVGGCTSCDADWFSWRSRQERGRHALVVAAVSG